MSTGSPPRSARARKLIGTTIGERYKVMSMLGEGAMGEVFLVEHTGSGKRMALKLLNEETMKLPEAVARFEREAVAASSIHHPNVASAIDSGRTSDGALYVVYEYAAGQSLYERIVKGPLPPALALHITRQVASALMWAHGIGVIHRDIKAENIVLVVGEGLDVTAKVLDFGMAKVSSELLREASPGDYKSVMLTRLGTTLGTPAYMSPEQAVGGKVDGRTDLYSLGILLFEMLTGRLPFECDEPAELLRLHLAAPVPSLAEYAPGLQVPPGLEALVRKLLEKEPEQRYESAKALLAAIDGLIVSAKLQLGAVATPSSTPSNAPSSAEKKPSPPPQLRAPSLLNLADAPRSQQPAAQAASSPRSTGVILAAVVFAAIVIMILGLLFSAE